MKKSNALKTLFIVILLLGNVSSLFIHGTVPPLPDQPIPSGVRVIATDSLGKIHACPVTYRGAFSLQVPGAGEYLLEVAGDITSIYYNLRVVVGEDGVDGVEVRRDLLIPRGELDKDAKLEFVRKGLADYGDKQVGWKVIAKWGLYLFLGLGFSVFVLWFPRLVDSLSDEGYEVLTGERRLKIQDPNRILRTLWHGENTRKEIAAANERGSQQRAIQANKKNK